MLKTDPEIYKNGQLLQNNKNMQTTNKNIYKLKGSTKKKLPMTKPKSFQ